MRALGLSARGDAQVLKVARTIADLAGEPKVGITHIAASTQCRMLDRRKYESFMNRQQLAALDR